MASKSRRRCLDLPEEAEEKMLSLVVAATAFAPLALGVPMVSFSPVRRQTTVRPGAGVRANRVASAVKAWVNS